ncbi:MAG: putative ABC transporter permease [Acutalibacter sp.]|jgi:hypothetical protein
MYQDVFLFLAGSFAYPVLELLWRGQTHSSMALAGGICLCLINHVCCDTLEDSSMFSRCLAGSGVITGVELVMGLLLNRLLGFDIWDYSNVPLNLLGQVCLPYSFLWMGLSLPAMAFCELFRESSLETQASRNLRMDEKGRKHWNTRTEDTTESAKKATE